MGSHAGFIAAVLLSLVLTISSLWSTGNEADAILLTEIAIPILLLTLGSIAIVSHWTREEN